MILGKLKSDRKINFLKKLLEDNNDTVRLSAKKALDSITLNCYTQETIVNRTMEKDNNNRQAEIDRDSIIQETNDLMKKINFTVDRGRKYLQDKYNKTSRLQLTDKELLDFKCYLLSIADSQNRKSEELSRKKIIDRTNVLLQELSWRKEDGVSYLVETYQKKSRLILTDKELLEFQDYLERQVVALRNKQKNIDFNKIIKDIDRLIIGANWTKEIVQNYLIKTYDKKSLLFLSHNELLEFKGYLQEIINGNILHKEEVCDRIELVESEKDNTIEIEIDFQDIIDEIDILMEKLGWTKKDGRNYLLQTYNKTSRILLSDRELFDFKIYLQQQL